MLKAAVAVAATLGIGAAPLASAQEKDKIRIGWAVSKSGPYAGGAAIGTLPNYVLWVKEVNDAGGIMLSSLGKRLPVEVVEYDDRSNSEEAVRAVERLITQDKVDFVLAPWGTALNLAIAPTLNKHGYLHLAFNTLTNQVPNLAKRWNNIFFFEGRINDYAESVVDMLVAQRDAGKIGDKVAIVSIADSFGIDLAKAARERAKEHGFKIVYDKSYPGGTQDMTPMLNEIKGLQPDAFLAMSYPPDTLLLTDQSRVVGFNPKVFYTGVGTAFPIFKQRFGENATGVMSIGGMNFDSPPVQDYFKRHVEASGVEPDRFAGPITYAGLQAFQQAVEKVGAIDHPAIIKELKQGSFETILGPITLENQSMEKLWFVGQWQDGEFYGIEPRDRDGARPAIIPKPDWKS